MKQFIAWLFLLVYIGMGPHSMEVLKMPVLAQHYQEHKVQNEQLSVAEYITQHYLRGEVKDADYARDIQLPFKSPDLTITTTASVFIPSHFPELTFAAPLPGSMAYTVLDDRLNLLRLPIAIWQPPQS